MPTIKQLPAATAVTGPDLFPVSQNGLTRSVTVSTLLSTTQPLLSLSQGSVLGRASSGLGSPEALNVGEGLTIQSGALTATAQDHLTLPSAISLQAGDEIILNSGGSPKRLTATQLRSIFNAGSGIQIDTAGVISVITPSSSGGTGVTGAKGDTGAQGPAGQGFTFRDAWSASTQYSPYDVVTYDGQCYVAPVAIAASPTFVASSWVLIAARGSPGPAGPTTIAALDVVGVVKPGAGLTVAGDGTLSVNNIAVSSLAQDGAAVGNLLSWSGTGWGATAAPATMNLSGAAPIVVASGVVSIGQSGATIGQVLGWSGTNWVPQALPANGAQVGSAVPLADGTAAAGAASTASREDHRHPSDLSRAPLAAPVFTTSLTLPIWTTTTRPSVPSIGMEGFASDSGMRETYTSSGWTQYVRLTDIPAGNGQLLGATASVGQTSVISIGAGLTLTGATLSVTGSQAGPAISGVSIDGASIVASPASPYQMGSADRVIDVNKSSGAATKVTLPGSPVLWVEYAIIDGRGDAGLNNITIAAPPGSTINGSPTFIMNANYDAVSLRAVSSTVWRVA